MGECPVMKGQGADEEKAAWMKHSKKVADTMVKTKKVYHGFDGMKKVRKRKHYIHSPRQIQYSVASDKMQAVMKLTIQCARGV